MVIFPVTASEQTAHVRVSFLFDRGVLKLCLWRLRLPQVRVWGSKLQAGWAVTYGPPGKARERGLKPYDNRRSDQPALLFGQLVKLWAPACITSWA